MPMLPIRNLGELGVIRDPAPYDLPPNALSKGRNVRFRYGRIERSPIFTLLFNTTLSQPSFCSTITDEDNADQLLVAGSNSTVYHCVASTQTDVTNVTWVP